MATLERFIADAPANHQNRASFDPQGVLEAMQEAGVSPDDVKAVSHCQFGTANIEALVDSDTLALIHPLGVLCTAGKRKVFGKAVKFNGVEFQRCRTFGPVEYTDERGLGKFGIEFAGPGNVLLGRLHWSWHAKRFRDPREHIMAAAEERDRVLLVINGLVG